MILIILRRPDYRPSLKDIKCIQIRFSVETENITHIIDEGIKTDLLCILGSGNLIAVSILTVNLADRRHRDNDPANSEGHGIGLG